MNMIRSRRLASSGIVRGRMGSDTNGLSIGGLGRVPGTRWRGGHNAAMVEGQGRFAMNEMRKVESEATRLMTTGGDARILLDPATGLNRYFSRSEEHTSELQSRLHLVCRLLLEKK